MGIAQSGWGGIFARLQRFANRLTGAVSVPAGVAHRPECVSNPCDAANRSPIGAAAGCRQTRSHRKPGAVRVVRVLEGRPELAVGRIVISGRLADVCAELDRLADLETAAQ